MRRRSAAPTCAGLIAGLSVAALFGGCQPVESPWKDVSPGHLRVLTSFPPLYCFAANVAGDDAGVLCLLTTVGPHEFSPKAHDVFKARGADLFLVNGLGLDDFVTKIRNNSGNPKLKVVAVGEAVPEKQRLALGEIKHEGHVHKGSDDPHVWLGIPEAVLMVERIRDELKEKDPGHAAGYEARGAAYVQELHKLQEDGQAMLKGKKNRRIIATHESLGYFARAFGLELEGSIQPRPGVDADAAQLASLVELCEKKEVRVIAVEPQYSRATADTLGKQLKGRGQSVTIVEVDPVETVAAAADGKLDPGFYVQKMRENITNLARQLP